LPPEAMLKILKSRVALPPSKPLMVSEEEPGPLMVRVPTRPPPPEALALAFKIVGNEALPLLFWESSVMVPVMLKLIMSLPAVALARSMAARRDPVPESALVLTVKVVGVILSSRLRSWSRGEPEVLRAFRFWELLKSLRKTFKNIGMVLQTKAVKLQYGKK